eukprot:SAG31_NODE_34188_length_335_cov_1.305085_1_plen_111_part_11
MPAMIHRSDRATARLSIPVSQQRTDCISASGLRLQGPLLTIRFDDGHLLVWPTSCSRMWLRKESDTSLAYTLIDGSGIIEQLPTKQANVVEHAKYCLAMMMHQNEIHSSQH